MEELSNSLSYIIASAHANLALVATLIGILWVIQLLNAASKYYFNCFGLLPRTGRGLLGIIICPLLHGSFEHLFLNSIFLFILINLTLTYGLYHFIYATLIIVLLGGALVWLFGRKVIHVGASGLAMGYWGFLLLAAYTKGTIIAVLLAGLCLYFFAGMFFNLFPKDRRTSWEGHLFGFLAGLIAAYVLFRV